MNAEALLFHMLKGGVGKRTRDEMGAAIARKLRRTDEHYLFSDESAVLRNLRSIGFSEIPPIFNAQQIESIHRYFSDKTPIYYNDNPTQPCQAPARFAEWPQDAISACPEFAQAAHDPKLLRIAEAYLEAPPIVSILTAWWSYPSTSALGGMQHFHHDRDDFRCLKLFVYLTDVTETTGPHQFVDGTHDAEMMQAMSDYPPSFWTWLDRSHRKTEGEMREWFGPPRTITGPAGSTFLEDTRGLHRGAPPLSGPRLAFEICYTILPKTNGNYKPIPWDISSEATRLFYQRPFKQI